MCTERVPTRRVINARSASGGNKQWALRKALQGAAGGPSRPASVGAGAAELGRYWTEARGAGGPARWYPATETWLLDSLRTIAKGSNQTLSPLPGSEQKGVRLWQRLTGRVDVSDEADCVSDTRGRAGTRTSYKASPDEIGRHATRQLDRCVARREPLSTRRISATKGPPKPPCAWPRDCAVRCGAAVRNATA